MYGVVQHHILISIYGVCTVICSREVTCKWLYTVLANPIYEAATHPTFFQHHRLLLHTGLKVISRIIDLHIRPGPKKGSHTTSEVRHKHVRYVNIPHHLSSCCVPDGERAASVRTQLVVRTL